MRRLLIPLVLLLTAGMLVFAAACDDDDDNGDGGIDDIGTPVGGLLTPSDGADTTPSDGDTTPSDGDTTPSGGDTTPSDGADTTPGAGGGGTTLQISADNSESYDTDELRAPAGSVTVEFSNQEDGVVHNWALYPSADEVTEPIARTDLNPGPSTDSVTFTIEPGEYYFRCDAHPQMEGTFIAE